MEQVQAFPAKTFFVNMLTRDIDLSDAILDLLDNCVDGILRSKDKIDGEQKPYTGYQAKITINKDMFSIEDNCGGIPLEVAKEYAFRMGRPEQQMPGVATVGMYGIGMKRAIFKMGKNTIVSSYTQNEKFKVEIDKKWLEKDNEWVLPLEITDQIDINSPGTLIKVTDLYETISEQLENETYINNLKKLISNHFSFIINKGFEVFVNNEKITPHNILFIYTNEASNQSISPYMYKGVIEGVNVDLKVGIYRETPSEEDIEDDKIVKRTSEDSGWTIICNDRVVVYNDKTILTGWGEATVPSFHNQFIGIAGVVHFHSDDVTKLPLTTTKRGIDASTKLYLHTKKYMREGTKLFTSYTNKIKKDLKKEEEYLKESKKLSFEQLNNETLTPSTKMVDIPRPEKNETNAKRYTPVLPLPDISTTSKTIRFVKETKDIEKVSNFLFETPDRSPSEVGIECFNFIFKMAEEEN